MSTTKRILENKEFIMKRKFDSISANDIECEELSSENNEITETKSNEYSNNYYHMMMKQPVVILTKLPDSILFKHSINCNSKTIQNSDINKNCLLQRNYNCKYNGLENKSFLSERKKQCIKLNKNKSDEHNEFETLENTEEKLLFENCKTHGKNSNINEYKMNNDFNDNSIDVRSRASKNGYWLPQLQNYTTNYITSKLKQHRTNVNIENESLQVDRIHEHYKNSKQKNINYHDSFLSNTREELDDNSRYINYKTMPILISIYDSYKTIEKKSEAKLHELKKDIKFDENDSTCPTLEKIGSENLNNSGPNFDIKEKLFNENHSINFHHKNEVNSWGLKNDNHLNKLVIDLNKNLKNGQERGNLLKIAFENSLPQHSSTKISLKQHEKNSKLLLKNKTIVAKRRKSSSMKRERMTRLRSENRIRKNKNMLAKTENKLNEENINIESISRENITEYDTSAMEWKKNKTKEMDTCLIENTKSQWENKQNPKHWMTLKFHLEQNKNLYEANKEALKNKTNKDGTETLNKMDVKRKKRYCEDENYHHQKAKLKFSKKNDLKTISRIDNEKRLAKEFPTHNWLQKKLEKSGVCNPENKSTNGCGFNMKIYCDESQLHWKFSHDVNISSLKRQDKKNNDDFSNDLGRCEKLHSNKVGQQSKYKIPDDFRKGLKLCSHCLISCCQTPKDVNLIPSSNPVKDNDEDISDKTNDEMKTDSENIMNSPKTISEAEKLGFCLLKKRNNPPVQMVFPLTKTPVINEDVPEEIEIRPGTSEEQNIISQLEVPESKISADVQIQDESNESTISYHSSLTINHNNSITTGSLDTQYEERSTITILQERTDTANSNSENNQETLEVQDENINTRNTITISPERNDSTQSMSQMSDLQQSQCNYFSDSNNLERTNLNNSGTANTHIISSKRIQLESNTNTVPIVQNTNIHDSRNIVDSYQTLTDNHLFQPSNFTNPSKSIKFQTNWNRNRLQDTLIKKPIPIRIQEIPHNSYTNCNQINTNQMHLQVTQNATNYIHNKQLFIEAELERQKREFQQIDYIMSKKEKECEELLQLKHHKHKLLRQMEYEQKLISEYQRKSQISTKDCFNVTRAQHPGVQAIYSSEEERKNSNAHSSQLNQQRIHKQHSLSPIYRKRFVFSDVQTTEAKRLNLCDWNPHEHNAMKKTPLTYPPNQSDINKARAFLRLESKNTSSSIPRSIINNQNQDTDENKMNFNKELQNSKDDKIISQNINRPDYPLEIHNQQYISPLSGNNYLESHQYPLKEKQTNSFIPRPQLFQESTKEHLNLTKTSNFNGKQLKVNGNVPRLVNDNMEYKKSSERNGLFIKPTQSEVNKLIETQYEKTDYTYNNERNNKSNNLNLQKSVNEYNVEKGHSISRRLALLSKPTKDISNYPVTVQLLKSSNFPLKRSKTVMDKLKNNSVLLANKDSYQNGAINNPKLSSFQMDMTRSAKQDKLVTGSKGSIETITIDDDSNPPLNIYPMEEVIHTCKHCKNEASLLCSGCKSEWYCCPECQIAEWYKHSLVCKS